AAGRGRARDLDRHRRVRGRLRGPGHARPGRQRAGRAARADPCRAEGRLDPGDRQPRRDRRRADPQRQCRLRRERAGRRTAAVQDRVPHRHRRPARRRRPGHRLDQPVQRVRHADGPALGRRRHAPEACAGEAAARRPAAVLVGLDHPAGGTGPRTVHPQGLGHPGPARRARAAGVALGRARPAAVARAGRVRIRPCAGTRLLRAHGAAPGLRQRALPHRDPAHPGRGRHLPRQVRGAGRGPRRGPGPRCLAGDARADPEAVLALAPRQSGQPVLFRRMRRLPEAAALESLLVWLPGPGGDRRLRRTLPGAAADPARCGTDPARTAGGGMSAVTDEAWTRVPRLAGTHVALEPLQPAHAEGLRVAAADGELWNLWWTGVPAPDEVEGWLASALEKQAAGEQLAFTVRAADGRIVGSTRYYELLPQTPRLCIGYTWYARSVQRTGLNTEAKLLLLAHAFEAMGCASVGFHTSTHNHASRAAI